VERGSFRQIGEIEAQLETWIAGVSEQHHEWVRALPIHVAKELSEVMVDGDAHEWEQRLRNRGVIESFLLIDAEKMRRAKAVRH